MHAFSAHEPHLSTLEQISPQSYTRFILCFRSPSGVPSHEAVHILGQGLRATTAKVPVLNTVVVPVTDSNGRETKDVRGDHASIFAVKDLIGSTTNYEEIRSQGFPSRVFDGDLLCPTGIFAAPGSKVPTFLAQANLIVGGVLLGLSVYHGALDGTAVSAILGIWAQECRSLLDLRKDELETLNFSSGVFDKSRLSAPSGKETGSINNHPEFILLPEAPTALPSALTQTLKTQIFYLSPDSVSALKELASPKRSSSTQTQYSWISTNTAISALVWRSMITATFKHETPIPDKVSMFSSPLNARKRMNPPLAPDLIASAWCFQDSRLPVRSVLEAELADIALVIRKSIDRVDAGYIDSLINMVESVPDPSLLMPLAFTDLLKTSSMLTTWAGFPMYDFGWGDKLGGKCERVRTAASGMFNGMQVVLPELPKEVGGGFEIVIGLEDDAMERLKEDVLWSNFARLL